MVSADTLRRAAALLRERATACEPIHGDDDNHSWADEFDAAAHEKEHGYFSPDVSLALADWLEWVSARRVPFRHALAVARQILGEAS